MKSQLKELEILVKGCYEGQTKQFMSIVVFSFRNVVKNSCGKKAERRFKDLMAMGKCSNFKNSTISSCLTNYIEKLQGTLQAKQDKRLPLVCWWVNQSDQLFGYQINTTSVCCISDYYKFLGCLNDQVRPTCPNQSESILDLIRNIFQGIVDVACGDYTENSDKCESIIATPKKPNGAPFFKSFVVPLSSVWASL